MKNQKKKNQRKMKIKDFKSFENNSDIMPENYDNDYTKLPKKYEDLYLKYC